MASSECIGIHPTSPQTLRLLVVFDFTSPMDKTLCTISLEAVENALAWSYFTQGRATQCSVCYIDLTAHQSLKFTPLDGNFAIVSAYLRDIMKYYTQPRVAAETTLDDFKDFLTLALKNAVADLTKADPLPGTLIATVVSCRDGRSICEALVSLNDEAMVSRINAFQVVELSRAVAVLPSSSAFRATHGGCPLRPPVLLAVVPASTAAAALEPTLRSAWFMPCWSELLPLELDLGFGLSLKCVAAKSVLDPACMPVPEVFTLLGGGAGRGGGGDGGGGSGDGPVLLQGVTRVAADGVCEGSLFGMPLKVTWSPAAAFRWQDSKYRRNAHLFLALCESLTEKDEYLVARLQGGSHQSRVSGHFILIPGEDCMLLRPVASAELVLPTPPAPSLQYDGKEAAQAERQVRDALDAIPAVNQYHARDFPSGLCTALALDARFPQRLSLPRNAARRPPPAEPPGPSTEPPGPSTEPPGPPCTAPSNSDAHAVGVADAGREVINLSSSDEDEDLPEVNLRTLAPAWSAASAKAPLAAPHKLGTGGHPALQDNSALPPKRRRLTPPLIGLFKARRS